MTPTPKIKEIEESRQRLLARNGNKIMREFINQAADELHEAKMQRIKNPTHVGDIAKNLLQTIQKMEKRQYKTNYQVISDYPDSPFKIGDILRFDGIVWGCGEPQKFVRKPENYPNIFKPIKMIE